MTAAAPDSTDAAQRGRPKTSRLRGALVIVLVVLACLGVVVTGVAWWAHHTVFNTDGYMKVVGPIGQDPTAIQSLSDYVATQVVTATDLESRAAAQLPPKLQALAPLIADRTQTFVAKQTQKALSTPQAYQLWLGVNRVAHDKIVGLLRGENTYTYISGSDVKLNTLPLISQALVWIDQRLPGALSDKFSPPVIDPSTPPADAVQQISSWTGKPLPPDFGQVTLVTSANLSTAQTAVKWFDRLVIILPIVTALLVAAAIWLSRRRLRTVVELGVGVAVALLLTRVVTNRLQDALVAHIKSGQAVGWVKDIVSKAVEPLLTFTTWLIIIGVLIAVVAWLVGRHDVADATRATADRVLTKGGERAKPDAPLTRWVTAHSGLVRVAGLAVGLLLLLAASSWFVILLLLGIIVVYELVVSWLAGSWPYPPHGGSDASAAET